MKTLVKFLLEMMEGVSIIFSADSDSENLQIPKTDYTYGADE